MAIVSIIALAMYVLTRLHIIFPIEVLGENVFFGGSPGVTAAKDDPGVTLVEITDEDYECPSLFDAKNPLRRDLIYELINKVAQPDRNPAHDPKSVVVDIDLSGEWEPPPATTYKVGDLACSNGKKFPFIKPPPLNIASDKLTVVEPTRLVRGQQGKSIPVLADDKFSVKMGNKSEAKEALSLFPYDWDHRARSFLKQVEVRKGTTGEDFMKCETFPTLAMVASKDGSPSEGGWRDCGETTEEDRYFIDFPNSRIKKYTASEVLTEENISFKDQIVVIGGTYYAGRDSYFTPIGSLTGVELVGLSIDAVQKDKAIGEAKEWIELAVDLLIGAVLVFIGISDLGRVGTILTVAAIVVLPLVSSLLIFQTAKLFLNFTPIVLGAGAHMIYDRHQEARKHNRMLVHKLKLAASEKGDLRKTIRHLRRQRRELRLRNEELRRSSITENFNVSIETRRHGDEA